VLKVALFRLDLRDFAKQLSMLFSWLGPDRQPPKLQVPRSNRGEDANYFNELTDTRLHRSVL
jgi:hypothetical protein